MAIRHEKYMMLNGELTPEEFADTPYVYCNILTLDRKAYFVEEHIARLAASAAELFGEDITLSPQLIEQQITTLLEANHSSRNNNVRVEVRLDAVGDLSLYCHEATIYAGYVMRPLRPEPYIYNCDMPLAAHSTSASQATMLLAEAVANANGCGTALTTTHDGHIVMEPSRPLFLIKQGYIASAAGPRSVEKMIIEKAAQAIGLKPLTISLTASLLAEADEVIIADWQCITALSHHADHIYMDIVAGKIAKAAANLLR